MLYRNEMLRGSKENYTSPYDQTQPRTATSKILERNVQNNGLTQTLKNLNLEEADIISVENFERTVGKIFGTELTQTEMRSLIRKYKTEGGVSFQNFMRDYEKYHKVESGPFKPKTTYGRRPQNPSQKWDLHELEEKIRDRIELKNNGDGSFQFQTTRKMFSRVQRHNIREFLQKFLGFDVTVAESEAFFQKYRKKGSNEDLDVPRLTRVMLQGPKDYPESRRLSDAKHIYQSTTYRHHYNPVGSAANSEASGSSRYKSSPHFEDIDAYSTTHRHAYTPQSDYSDEREVWTPNGTQNSMRHQIKHGRPQSAPSQRSRSASQSLSSSRAGMVPNQEANLVEDDQCIIRNDRWNFAAREDDCPGESELRKAILKKGSLAGGFQFVRTFKACRAFLGTELVSKENLRRLAQRLYQVTLSQTQLDAIFSKYNPQDNEVVKLPIFLGQILRVTENPSGRWFHDKTGFIIAPNRRVISQPTLPREEQRETSRRAHWDMKKFEQCLREKMLLKTCVDGSFQYRDAFKLFHPARGPVTAKLSPQQLTEVLDERLEIVVDDELLRALFQKYDPEDTGKIAVKDLVRSLVPKDWDGTNFLTPRDAEEDVTYRALMNRVFDVTGKAHCITGLKGIRGMSSRNLIQSRRNSEQSEPNDTHYSPPNIPTNPALGGTVDSSRRPQSAMARSHQAAPPSARPKRPQTAGPSRRPVRPTTSRRLSQSGLPTQRVGSAVANGFQQDADSVGSDRTGHHPLQDALRTEPIRNVGMSPIVTGRQVRHQNHGNSYYYSPNHHQQNNYMEGQDRPETDSIKTNGSQKSTQRYILKAQHILDAIQASEQENRRAATQQQRMRSNVKVKGKNKRRAPVHERLHQTGTKTSQIRKEKTANIGRATFKSRYKKESQTLMNKKELKKVIQDTYGPKYTTDLL